MRKLTTVLLAAAMAAVLLGGCSSQSSSSAAVTTQAATTQASATTQAATTKASSAAATTQAASTSSSGDQEVIVSSTTKIENDVFSLSFPTDLFEESSDDDTEYFEYTGKAAYSVYLMISYQKDITPDEQAAASRSVEGMTILKDEKVKPSFWDEAVSCIQETEQKDGYTACYTLYFLPYQEGTMVVATVSYEEEDKTVASEFDTAMNNLLNSLKFN